MKTKTTIGLSFRCPYAYHSFVLNYFNTKLLVLSMFISFTTISFMNAQVKTRILTERMNIDEIIDNRVNVNPQVKLLSKPDVQEALDEDERGGKTIPRFAGLKN